MDLSEYIPLFIILASVIYSAVKGAGKEAKRKEQTAKTTLPGKMSEDESDFSFEDEFEDEFLEEPKPVLEKPASANHEFVFRKSKTTIADKVEGRREDSDFQSTPNLVEMSLEDDSVIEPILNVCDEDEVRRGIIYSEILARKKY